MKGLRDVECLPNGSDISTGALKSENSSDKWGVGRVLGGRTCGAITEEYV